MSDRFVPDEVIAERFERLRVVVERSALARAPGPGRTGRGGLVEGPTKRDPSVTTAGPARTSWSTSPRPRSGAGRRAPTPRSGSPAPPATICRATWSR